MNTVSVVFVQYIWDLNEMVNILLVTLCNALKIVVFCFYSNFLRDQEYFNL